VISLIFWSVLYPFENNSIERPKLSNWLEFMDHICPFVYVTIDWFLSGMKYEKSAIGINMSVVGAYGIVNITYTKITGNPVYSFISWNSLISWTIGFALIPFFALVFYLEYWLTTVKLNWIHKR
jgi:hypothetical protein